MERVTQLALSATLGAFIRPLIRPLLLLGAGFAAGWLANDHLKGDRAQLQRHALALAGQGVDYAAAAVAAAKKAVEGKP